MHKHGLLVARVKEPSVTTQEFMLTLSVLEGAEEAVWVRVQ